MDENTPFCDSFWTNINKTIVERHFEIRTPHMFTSITSSFSGNVYKNFNHTKCAVYKDKRKMWHFRERLHLKMPLEGLSCLYLLISLVLQLCNSSKVIVSLWSPYDGLFSSTYLNMLYFNTERTTNLVTYNIIYLLSILLVSTVITLMAIFFYTRFNYMVFVSCLLYNIVTYS